MAIDSATVEKFFEQGEWKFTKLDENVWRTGFRGRLRDFTILVRLSEKWLLMQIGMLNAPNPECKEKLYQHLLRMNFQMNMSKFGVDRDGEIMLMVEMPSEDLNYSEFQTGLMALIASAEGSFLEIANLAMDPNARSSLEVEEVSAPR